MSDSAEKMPESSETVNSAQADDSELETKKIEKSSGRKPEASETQSERADKGVEEIQSSLDDLSIEKYVQDGKNKFALKCPRCGSKILEKLTGAFVIVEQELPSMYMSADKSAPIPKDTVKEYFHVENMYTFDNIGFTHRVDDFKYLSCADCETGPLGFFRIQTSESYVALSRVTHA